MEDGASVARELAARRRSRRRAITPIGDRLTNIYAAVVSVVVFVPGVGSLFSGDESAAFIDVIHRRGASYVGLLFALLLCGGIRSGARGGPLVLQPADVNLLLLSPVDPADVLRPRVRRLLVIATAAAFATGAVVGAILSTRAHGNPAAWSAAGGLATAVAVGAALGAAVLVNRLELRPGAANALCAAMVTWAAVDLALATESSPTSALGAIAVSAENGFGTAAAIGLVAGIVVVGVSQIGSVRARAEHALARSAAASAFTDAIGLQDIRGLIRASHAGAEYAIRRRPWAPPPPPASWASWRRSWKSVLRLPVMRLVRIIGFAAAAGGVARAAWDLPAAAIVAVGLAYLAGLEAIEPIGQEMDRPTRHLGYPVSPVALYARLQAPPVVLVAAGFVLGSVIAGAVAGTDTLTVELVVAPAAALAAVAAATYAGARGRPDLRTFLLDPLGQRIYWFHLMPAALAGSGMVAIVVAEAPVQNHLGSPIGAAVQLSYIPMLAAAIGWGLTAWRLRSSA